MKVVGMLSWYDENPNWLSACVAAMSRFCDHLVACDGPYALFPGALSRPKSGFDQIDAISRACEATGMGLTLYQQSDPWLGEVEKRDWMLRLAPLTPDDWILIVDADELVSGHPEPFRKALEETEHDVAELTLWEQIGGMEPCHHPLRRVFRALPDLRFEEAHYVLTATKDGQKVWLSGLPTDPLETPLDLRDVRLEHRNRYRLPIRASRAIEYYARRDEAGIERRRERVDA